MRRLPSPLDGISRSDASRSARSDLYSDLRHHIAGLPFPDVLVAGYAIGATKVVLRHVKDTTKSAAEHLAKMIDDACKS